jgi:hypothetical protein
MLALPALITGLYAAASFIPHTSASPIMAITPRSNNTAKRQSGVQVISNCANNGQAAMTFDGASCFPCLLITLTSHWVG